MPPPEVDSDRVARGEGVVEPHRADVVGMALVLDAMASRRMKVSELVAELPRYEIVKRTIDLDSSKLPSAFDRLEELFADAKADRLDGLRLDWADRWLIVRGSNTEPMVRIIAEAPTAAETSELIEKACDCLRTA